MKVLLVGASGMLGQDVAKELEASGHEVATPDHLELDITDPMSVAKLPAGELGSGFAWCINCAAYTAVDAAETDEEAAAVLNGLAPGYLAQACGMAGVRLLQVSTDFVFDGSSSRPYLESDPTGPMGVYGKTKLAGERSAISANASTVVVRTAWLFGNGADCFPSKLIRAWKQGKPLKVVADQLGSPTYTKDLARVLVDLIENDADPGIYHAAGPEVMSWRDFTVAALEAYREAKGLTDAAIEVEPIRTEDWPTPASRPRYSVMSFEKLAAMQIRPMRPLREALAEYVSALD